jgi:predicted polyphosphate/ATP-dependent NAD kinase
MYTRCMPAVVVDIDSDTYERLSAIAKERGVTVPAVVQSIVQAAAIREPNQEFMRAVREVIEEYRPVLNRLAE